VCVYMCVCVCVCPCVPVVDLKLEWGDAIFEGCNKGRTLLFFHFLSCPLFASMTGAVKLLL